MTMKNKIPIVFLVLLAFPFGKTEAQLQLTEPEAIELALQYHPSVKAAALQSRQADVLKGSAAEWPAARLFQHTAADPDFGLFGTVSFGVQQDFPSVKMTRANRLYYERLKARSEAFASLTRQEVIRQVREIYHHLSYLEAKKKLFTSLDSVYNAVAQTAQLRYETGETSLAEKLASEDRAGQIALAAQTVSHEIEFDRLVLAQLLGVEQEVEPIVEPIHEATFSLEDTSRLSSATWAALYRSEVALAQAEYEKQAASLAPAFSTSVFGQYLGNGDWYPGWEIGVNIPIAKKSLNARKDAAQVGVEAAKAQYQQAYLQKKNALAHLFHEQEKYQISVRYYHEKGAGYARELLQSGELNYRLGELSYADFAMLLEQATRIELQYLDDLLGLNQTLIELEALTAE